MRKILLIFFTTFFMAVNINAQKKFVFDFNINFNNSIAHDILNRNYRPNITIEYFKRKKYKNPFLNITGNILYPVGNNILVGLRSGVYLYLREQYFTSAQITSFSIPLQFIGRYNFLSLKENLGGISLEAGFNFFNIYDYIERYNNGKLLKMSVFYLIHKKNLIEIGIEKQINNVVYYIYKLSQYNPNQIFEYKQKRLSIALSYGIEF